MCAWRWEINLKMASERQQKYYNLRRREWIPEIGDLVYIKEHKLSSAADSYAQKLGRKFTGPFRVHNYESPNIIIVLPSDNPTGKRVRVHIKDIKPVPAEN